MRRMFLTSLGLSMLLAQQETLGSHYIRFVFMTNSGSSILLGTLWFQRNSMTSASEF
jgi:hypothetical protein